MRLLVGLGNPGSQYAGTRHNVGFAALETLGRRHDVDINRKRFSSLVGRGRIGGVDVLMIQPQSYMNLSGGPVRRFMDFYKGSPEDVLVLHDDMDVEIGRLKVSARGGAGGHKGIASIIEHLGTSEFARIKIGVGRPPSGRAAESYVLGRFDSTETPCIERVLVSAASAAELFISSGVAETQARYNRRDLNLKD